MVLISTKCLYFSFFFSFLFYLYGTDIHEVLDVALHLRTHGGIHERTFVRRDCYYWSLFFLFFCLFFTHPRTHIRQKRLLLLVSNFSFLFLSLQIHERTFVKETAITGLYFFFSFFVFFTHPRTHIRQKRPTCKQKRDPLISLEKKRTYLYASKETYQHRHT